LREEPSIGFSEDDARLLPMNIQTSREAPSPDSMACTYKHPSVALTPLDASTGHDSRAHPGYHDRNVMNRHLSPAFAALALCLIGLTGPVIAATAPPPRPITLTAAPVTVMKGELTGADAKTITDRLYDDMSRGCSGQGYEELGFVTRVEKLTGVDDDERYVVRAELSCDMHGGAW
jgi:hypothetical protein